MVVERMQAARFELKYIISERTAEQIRQYVGSFLELDKHARGKPNLSYPVHSLYLDSEEMRTYWDTINSTKNRFKLRLRFYGEDPETPIFLEIKRRIDSCIQKQRAAVQREVVGMILRGQLPPPQMVLSHEPRHTLALQNFCRMVQEMRAGPKMRVAYFREAYLPRTDNSARLTMDRQVSSEPTSMLQLSGRMERPLLVWGNAVVLELKFTNRYPNWFEDLVRTFELKRCGAAKYADGVSLLSGRIPQHRHTPCANPSLNGPVGEVVQRESALLALAPQSCKVTGQTRNRSSVHENKEDT